MNTLIAIALGGAAGALGRYAVSRVFTDLVHPSSQPLATMAVNIVGCGAMGLLAGLAMAGTVNLSEPMRGFLMVGLLGALTTFSSFSFDVFRLAEKGGYGMTLLYVAASVLLSLLAFFACMKLARIA